MLTVHQIHDMNLSANNVTHVLNNLYFRPITRIPNKYVETRIQRNTIDGAGCIEIMLAPSILTALFLIMSILHVSYARKGVIMWSGFIWLRTETGGGSCKNGTKRQGSMKSGKFLQLVEQLLVSERGV